MSDTAPRTRIWYQSFVDPVGQAAYIDRLRARLAALAGPGVAIDLHGMVPPDRHFHPLSEFRGAQATIAAALRAEAEGCAAFVIGHFQEPGLTECRGAVDIPVIGLGEATMLFACSLARKVGLVTIDPVFVPWHEAQIERHGLARRVIGVTAIRADLPRFMRAFTDPAEHDAVCAEFASQVRPLIARGADLLIPAGGLPMLLLAGRPNFTVDGVPVLDGVATVLKAAEMAVAMHRITGVAASRAGLFARASTGAIADFQGATTLVP